MNHPDPDLKIKRHVAIIPPGIWIQEFALPFKIALLVKYRSTIIKI